MSIIGTPSNISSTYKWDGPRLKTLQNLKDYILRRLGSEAVNIELTDDNLNDAIYDTLDLYFQYAYSGVVERYIPIQIEKNKQEYPLPYNIYSVLGIDSFYQGGVANAKPDNMFSLNQYVASDLYRGSGKIDLLTYTMTLQQIETMNIVFAQHITFDFDCVNRNLYLFAKPIQNETVLMHVYVKNTPIYDDEDNEITNLYNEYWIKNYATERARLQWADNMMKYNGTTMPGGVTLDVATILQRATESLEKLTLQLEEEYRLPIDMMIG